MTNLTFHQIAVHAGREYGTRVAMVVFAALEVAAKRWTEEDTTLYGTMVEKELHKIESTE